MENGRRSIKVYGRFIEITVHGEDSLRTVYFIDHIDNVLISERSYKGNVKHGLHIVYNEPNSDNGGHINYKAEQFVNYEIPRECGKMLSKCTYDHDLKVGYSYSTGCDDRLRVTYYNENGDAQFHIHYGSDSVKTWREGSDLYYIFDLEWNFLSMCIHHHENDDLYDSDGHSILITNTWDYYDMFANLLKTKEISYRCTQSGENYDDISEKTVITEYTNNQMTHYESVEKVSHHSRKHVKSWPVKSCGVVVNYAEKKTKVHKKYLGYSINTY